MSLPGPSRWEHATMDIPPVQVLHLDLDRHKEKFLRLYIDEDRTLKDVMSILRNEDGCNASSNMYQRCIRKWNVGKYPKYPEMLDFLRAIHTRKTKKTAPITQTFRGRTFGEEHVAQYFYKKFGYRTIDEAIEALIRLNKPERGKEISFTIAISPPTELEFVEKFFDTTRLFQVQMLSAFILPENVLEGPSNLANSDHGVYRILQHRLEVTSSNPNAHHQWYNSFCNGVCEIADGYWKTGFAAIQRSFTCIGEILICPSYQLLTNTMILIVLAIQKDQKELGRMLACQMCGYANIKYGSDHALTRWFKHLIRQHGSMESLRQGMMVASDFTCQTLGRRDGWGVRQKITLLNAEVGMDGYTLEQLIERHEGVLQEIEACRTMTYPNKSWLPVESRRYYATHLSQRGMFAQAEKVLSCVPEIAEGFLNDKQVKMFVFVLGDLALSIIRQGDVARAEALLTRSIAVGSQRLMPDDPGKLRLVRMLAKLYQNHGDQLKAETMENEYSYLLNLFKLPEAEQTHN